MSRNAVVLLSGGLDSATALAIARDWGLRCHALTVDYDQRHRCELDAARAVAGAVGVAEHRVVKIDLRTFGGSALTADIDVPKDSPDVQHEDDIPITYVPARNTIFLSYALAYAEVIDARDIVIGVNAVDYSGYPDCRPGFIAAFEKLANLATKIGVESVNGSDPIRIHAPLINLTKKQIIERGIALGVDYGITHSCYDPDATGRPCGHCDSCLLRAEGFAAAGVGDPAIGNRQ